jgi:hypothetical protein
MRFRSLRSYIFTPKERRAIEAFLEGKLKVTDHLLSQVRTRLKQFTRLRNDVELYIRLREAVATVSA